VTSEPWQHRVQQVAAGSVKHRCSCPLLPPSKSRPMKRVNMLVSLCTCVDKGALASRSTTPS